MTDVDYRWLMCGDYAVHNGDFDDTSEDAVSYELQETISRARLSKDEMLHDSIEISGNLETWLGSAVSEDAAKAIKERLNHALTYYRYLSPQSTVEIKTLVLSDREIGVYLKLYSRNYKEVYINVYMDFEDGTAAMLVEESTDVRHPQ